MFSNTIVYYFCFKRDTSVREKGSDKFGSRLNMDPSPYSMDFCWIMTHGVVETW